MQRAVTEGAQKAFEGAQKGFHAAEERVEEFLHQSEECVSRHQIGSVVTAFAAGIVLGFFLARPRRQSFGGAVRDQFDQGREALVGLGLAGLAMGSGALRSMSKDARKRVNREMEPVRRAARQAAEKLHIG